MMEVINSRILRTIPLLLMVMFFCPFAYSKVINVDDDGQADFDNIQAGIDAAEYGDTVCVAPGTYYENVTLKDGINLLGAGADVTIIDANGYGDVVDVRANNVTICGFTLRNSGENDLGHMNCGVYVFESDEPVIRDNVIVSNRTGIGIWYGVNPDIRNNIIKNNSNGLYIYGLEESPSNPRIINNTIVNNEINGITLRVMVSPVIVNNIIAGHITGINHNYVTSSPTISYNNLWHNDVNYMRDNRVDDTLAGPGSISVDPYFAEPGSWADVNDPNIVVEPNDPNAVWIDGDYHLKAGSPCINRGDPNYAADPNETDLDGNPRVQGGRIDMGAYEYPFVFAMSDLAGTWQVHHLNSGNAPAWLGWSRFDLSIDDHGNFAIVRGTYLNSSGETDAATTGTLTITSDGILWMPFLVVGSDNRNVHGALGSSKEFVVTTMDDEGGYNLSILQKRSGATFSTSDLAGTWSVHGLISGDAPAWTGWYHFDKVINSDGTFSSIPGSFRNSDGDMDATAGGTMTIDGNGIVQVTEIPSYHGRLSDRKDLVVGTMNNELGGYDLHIAMRRSESSFAITDMAGIWHIHGLAVGDAPQWTGWVYGTLAVNADGTSSGILHNSDGETTHIGGTISIANDGVFSMEGFSYTHGVLSSDKDLIVLVATDSFDNHQMLIGTRAQPNASFVDYVPIDPNLHDIKTFEWTHGRTGLYIGASKTLEPGSFFSGMIDDVRIYNRAVTP